MLETRLETICPLPWLHFSLQLDTRMRICCNSIPSPNVISNENDFVMLKDIKDINSFFNLNFFKNIRRQMLNGERPHICKKCYDIEDAGSLSVRQDYLNFYKQNDLFREAIIQTQTDGTISAKVQSLDFSLSNLCNLECVMCTPNASYKIKSLYNALNIEYDKKFIEDAYKNWNNIDNLIELIKQMAPTLNEVLTTGGEPFINKTHETILDALIETQHSENINLTYHTNCMVKNTNLFNKWNYFKKVNIHFSLDAFGELNNYIRFGSNWETIASNISFFLDHPKVSGEIHSTIQVLNIFNLIDLYEWINYSGLKIPRLPFHIKLDYPNWLNIDILPNELKEKCYNKLNSYFNSLDKNRSFKERETQILSYVKMSLEKPQDELNLNFFKERIRKIEKIRKLSPVTSLVPDLKTMLD